MFSGLQIHSRRERILVGLADLVSAPLGWRGPRRALSPPARILLLRLERIGDLLMVLGAIQTLRGSLPGATIDLAVGSWNRDLAALVPGINKIEILDVPWLARDGGGDTRGTLVQRARAWRGRYDLVVNFEPDIRSNGLAWLSGAPRRFGYWTGGGGALLTDRLTYDQSAHVSDNAARLVARVLDAYGVPVANMEPARLRVSPQSDATALQALAQARGPHIGVHVSGGRESKQWHLDRFARVARTLAERYDATIVLTGSTADRPLVDAVRRDLGGVRVIDAAGAMDLPVLGALLARLDVLVTSDTGPMHLAAAMGTPLVALFGPSDPRRYGPRGSEAHVLRVDLWCSPCGQVRLPPERCRGHVPDCMDGIEVERVIAAAADLLAKRAAV